MTIGAKKPVRQPCLWHFLEPQFLAVADLPPVSAEPWPPALAEGTQEHLAPLSESCLKIWHSAFYVVAASLQETSLLYF